MVQFGRGDPATVWIANNNSCFKSGGGERQKEGEQVLMEDRNGSVVSEWRDHCCR